MIEKSAGRQHLCDALTADKGWPRATLATAAQRFRETLDRPLATRSRLVRYAPTCGPTTWPRSPYRGAALRAAHPSRARGLQACATDCLNGLRTPGGHEICCLP